MNNYITIDGLPYRRLDTPDYRLGRVYWLGDLNLKQARAAFAADPGDFTYDWDGYLRNLLIDPDEADETDTCTWCGEPDHTDDLTWVERSEGLCCESCLTERFTQCSNCEEFIADGDTTTTTGDEEVCGRCLGSFYSWCEECEEYFHQDDFWEYHSHTQDTSGDCCTSPALSFTFGMQQVAADEEVTVTLPSGIISDDGMYQLTSYLRGLAREAWLDQPVPWVAWVTHPFNRAANELYSLGQEWQNKGGNFTKRLSKMLYKDFHGYKLTPEQLGKVGDFARAHSNGAEVTVAVTRDLNMSAEDFAHEDSCWWTDFSHSRCTLKSNGGFGLRSFSGDSRWNRVQGRCWVLPLKLNEGGDLRPTFDTEKAAAYFVFNGYGDLDGYTGPRIVAAMTGHSYKRVSVPGGSDSWGMYVNGDSGYLVGPEDLLADYSEFRLSLNHHADLWGQEQRGEMQHVAAGIETIPEPADPWADVVVPFAPEPVDPWADVVTAVQVPLLPTLGDTYVQVSEAAQRAQQTFSRMAEFAVTYGGGPGALATMLPADDGGDYTSNENGA